MKPLLIAALVLPLFAVPAFANDTMSQLGTGGLMFVTSDKVTMTSEDLFVSTDQVRVKYQFTNTADSDQTSLVSFPLPDITGSGDFMASVPGEDPANLFNFSTTFDGEPVEATLHQYVFAFGVDYSDLLRGLGVPFTPFGSPTTEALNALDPADQQKLLHLGLVIPMEYDSGSGWMTDYVPVWTLRSTYTWEATFKAGTTHEVVHIYQPSVGGTVAVTFLAEPYDNYDPATEYKKKYCTDEGFVNSVKKTLPDPKEPYGAPFTEMWLSYIWSTGANWNGPIGKFRLTIDKGRPENLVSFCWDGKVTKTSPTTFEMEATDFYPPYDRELEILILNRNDPDPNVG